MQLPSLSGVRVLVVGDVMLDRYWSGSAGRVSAEAPVPVVAIEHTEERPGGAANVALNVASLGARCTLVGVVGDDDAGRSLTTRLEAAGVTCDLVVASGWSTIIKLRVLSRKQQLLRADFESPVPEAAAREAARRADKHAHTVQAMVLQDYDKGTLLEPRTLIAGAPVPAIVDPKNKPFAAYEGADLVKPNAAELAAAGGVWADESDLVATARRLCLEARLGGAVVTRGAQGMTVVAPEGGHQHLPAMPVDVFDVTGAGDTAAAALGITRALGLPVMDCARIANAAAGLAVAKSGTAVVSGPELARALAAELHPGRGVMSAARLEDAVRLARAAGERVVFTNGCFDILHAGHVAYLEEASRLGDRLVVAVNGDESVRRLKGPGRPVNPLEQRMRVLAGLAVVDWVTTFAEDTPERLLAALAPDMLVKGGDYALDEVVGADIVRAAGGEVRVLSRVDDCSTSAIIERLQSD